MGRVLTYLVVFVAGGLAALGLMMTHDLFADSKPPQLAAGLPEPADQRGAAWSERLARTFPDGTLEANVISTLSEQGFRLHARDGQLWADFDRSAPVCSENLTATWRTDETGAVQAMAGTVHMSCL